MAAFHVDGNILVLHAEGKTHQFRSIEYIEPQINDDGTIFIDRPQTRYRNFKKLDYNRHCDKDTEFTMFRVEKLPAAKGVYIWLIDNEKELSYIGEGVDLRKRFSSAGYGRISPRNCFVGGQSTNCKMNHEVLSKWREGKRFHLYILETEDHKEIEKDLIAEYHPKLNKKNNSERSSRNG